MSGLSADASVSASASGDFKPRIVVDPHAEK
jgi:hypothetical protein